MHQTQLKQVPSATFKNHILATAEKRRRKHRPMPTVSQPGYFNLQEFTSAGALMASGRLYTYTQGTTTKKTAYTDAAGSTAHTYTSDGIGGEYIALDARGELPAPLYLTSGAYDICLKTSAGATVWTRRADPVGDLGISLAASGGSALVGYVNSGTGAVTRTLQARGRDRVSVLDYIPVALHADIAAGTSATAVQSYFAACALAHQGKDIFVPSGTYMFTQGFALYSKQSLVGEAGTKIKALTASWAGTTGVTGTGAFVYNNNNNTTTLTDEDISVENIEFDYDTVTIVGGGAHAIRFRAVDRPRVANCRFNAGENGVAFLACRDSLIDKCEAYEVINCFYDHWDGAISGTVRNCIGRNTVDMAQGIQFTGTGSALEDRNSYLFLAEGNRLFGVRGATSQASAIIFNANDAGSTVSRCVSSNNYIEDSDLGIVFQGTVGQNLSVNDTLKGVDICPILMVADGSGAPSYSRVENPHLIDCDHSAGSVAMISITGTGNEVTGVKVTNSGAAAYDYIATIVAAAVSCRVEIENAVSGTSGRCVNASTTSHVRDEGVRAYYPKSLPTIASATTIAPTDRVTKISGTTTIQTITVPSGTQPGESIVLVPTGLWATNNSGNIALATTAVVSKALTLTWDPDAGVWFPSY